MTEMIGKKFERWTVIAKSESGPHHADRWECVCDCGTKRIVLGQALRNGKSRSCGCLHREIVRQRSTIHGGCHTPEYSVWQGMIHRCTNPRAKNYHRYGGRGITVCDRWRVFENFIADMGQRPSPDHELERTDNNAGYEPGNVIWAPRLDQMRNQDGNLMLTFRGVRLCATDWSKITGLTTQTIRKRVIAGMSDEEVLTKPRHCDRTGKSPESLISTEPVLVE